MEECWTGSRLDPDQLDVIEKADRDLDDCATKALALRLKRSYVR
jgi:hypothetical protein